MDFHEISNLQKVESCSVSPHEPGSLCVIPPSTILFIDKSDKYFTRTVADPGFSRGGGGREPSRGGREHAKFSRKLHEIERIWTPRGGRASLTPPLDPPMS